MSVAELWPELGVQSNAWTLNYRQNTPTSNAGNSISVDHGEAYWTAKITVDVPRHSALEKEWSAFFSRRQGSRVTFSMSRTFQNFPADGTGIPSTPPSITSVDRETRQIILGNIGSYSPSVGDMVGYFTAESGFYVGEIDTVTSVLVFTVNPPPFAEDDTEPNFRFIKALGEFRIIGTPRITENTTTRSWAFSAEQVIRG